LQRIALDADDQALATALDDDGRVRGARPGEDEIRLGGDAGALELLQDAGAHLVVADRPPEDRFAAERGDGTGGIGGHAADAAVMARGPDLGGPRRKGIDPVDRIEGRMADADDAA